MAREKSRRRAFTLIELMIVIAIIAIIAAIAIPNLMSARKHSNEAGAIGSLKAIASAQAMFREMDTNGNGNLDYGTRAELGATKLLDNVLGSGVKQGYIFEVQPSPMTPEFLWFASANPVAATTTGDRYFELNHTGVIHYTLSRAASLVTASTDCAIESGFIPIGK